MPALDAEEGIDQVAELVALYGIDDATAAVLTDTVVDYHEAARDERIIISRARNILSVQRRIRKREESTRHLRSFTAGLVFGHMQTAEYAAAIFGTDVDSPKVLDRMRRGVEKQWNADRRYVGVIAEGALVWTVGSAEVMARQCEHLTMISQLPNVELYAVPARTVVPGIAPSPGFHIHDADQVVLSQVDGEATLTSPEHITRYVDRFERLREAALADDAAREFLAEFVSRYSGR